MPRTVLRNVARVIDTHLGLDYAPARERDLELRLERVANDMHLASAAAAAEAILTSHDCSELITTLARHLTVGETYFFRDQACFDRLGSEILPALIRTRRNRTRTIRIWSAGCCTGEEAYSVAILLDRLLPDKTNWEIAILATDVNPTFIDKASTGRYTDWSFRSPPPWLRDRYFNKEDDHTYQIRDSIKNMVHFDTLNLVSDSYPSTLNGTQSMDIILCRNVLMYFSLEKVRQIVTRFHLALSNNGIFVASPTESSMPVFGDFLISTRQQTTFFTREPCSPVEDEAVARSPCVSVGDNSRISNPTVPLPRASVNATTASDWSAREPDAPHDARAPIPSEAIDRATRDCDCGRYAEALQTIFTHKLHETGCKSTIRLLVRIYTNQGNLDDAAVWTQRAVEQHKLDPVVHYLQAVVMIESGDCVGAETALKRALFLDAEFIAAHVAMGRVALARNMRTEARRHYRNAVSILEKLPDDDIVPETDDLTAAGLAQTLRWSTSNREKSTVCER